MGYIPNFTDSMDTNKWLGSPRPWNRFKSMWSYRRILLEAEKQSCHTEVTTLAAGKYCRYSRYTARASGSAQLDRGKFQTVWEEIAVHIPMDCLPRWTRLSRNWVLLIPNPTCDLREEQEEGHSPQHEGQLLTLTVGCPYSGIIASFPLTRHRDFPGNVFIHVCLCSSSALVYCVYSNLITKSRLFKGALWYGGSSQKYLGLSTAFLFQTPFYPQCEVKFRFLNPSWAQNFPIADQTPP